MAQISYLKAEACHILQCKQLLMLIQQQSGLVKKKYTGTCIWHYHDYILYPCYIILYV